jgi:membrane protein YqaA with SNARE-associated domain
MDEAELKREPPQMGATISRLAALAFAVLITAAIIIFRERLAGLGTYGYAGVFLVSLLGNATVILPAPSILAVFAGGGVFNPLVVGLTAGVGEALGELTGYMAGYGGQAVIENRDLYGRLEGWMRRNGAVTILLLSTIPNPFFDLAGIAAGALRFPLWRFLLICWLGKTIKSLAIALLGAQSIRLLERFP